MFKAFRSKKTAGDGSGAPRDGYSNKLLGDWIAVEDKGQKEADKLNVLEYLVYKTVADPEMPLRSCFSGFDNADSKTKKSYSKSFSKMKYTGSSLATLFYGEGTTPRQVAFFDDLLKRSRDKERDPVELPLPQDGEEAEELVRLFKVAKAAKEHFEAEAEALETEYNELKAGKGKQVQK